MLQDLLVEAVHWELTKSRLKAEGWSEPTAQLDSGEGI